MQTALATRIDQLVELGWEPVTTTETSASLAGRRPFHWWLFLFVIVSLLIWDTGRWLRSVYVRSLRGTWPLLAGGAIAVGGVRAGVLPAAASTR